MKKDFFYKLREIFFRIKDFIFLKIEEEKVKIKKTGKLEIFKLSVIFCGFIFTFCFIIVFILVVYFSITVPDHRKLKNYEPPITTRLYSTDGKLLKEYAKEKRLFVPISQIPEMVKNAFISAEDSTFYKNSGINIRAIFIAGISNIFSKIVGKGQIRGGSTITQQVAKNFFLTRERTISRKIKEAIISIRLANSFTKDEILELYLNQIFLGNRSYGVASAALNYFNKSLDELTIEECALLAALPKAPTKLDPTKKDTRDVLDRRNWIIERMNILGYISKQQAENAINTPIIIREKNIDEIANGEFFSGEVKKEFVKMYGETKLLEGGNVVITTIDPKLQNIADNAIKMGIEDYDKRHGYRGAIDNIVGEIDFDNNWGELINNYQITEKYRKEWNKAVILDVDSKENKIIIGLGEIEYDKKYKVQLESNPYIKLSKDNNILITGYIPIKNAKWAKYINQSRISYIVKNVKDFGFKKGDIIVVEKNPNIQGEYFLKQIPNVNGALLAMNPHNGKILAMMGGYIDSQSDFNRAIQAERQTGSVAKPFAYLTAFENGFTPASIVIDEPIELPQGENRPPYRPKNNENKFYGPTTLRVGLEKSINVTTVRLSYDVGIGKVVNTIKRFGVAENPKMIYSIALGSMESNLLKMVRAYSMIVNGGKEITPHFIEKIEDKNGKTIYKTDNIDCPLCIINDENIGLNDIQIPILADNRAQITDSATAYQMTSLLEGVVKRGTGWRAKSIGKIVGGKTGTTNNANDAWFIGFSPNLVVGVYVGFDIPSTLGSNETGSSVASPIFVNFMSKALRNVQSIPFRVPPTIHFVRIDTKTGYYPTVDSDPKDVILEAFKLNDKITKFDEEVSEEEINNYLEYQENSRDKHLEIITNYEENTPESKQKQEEFEKNNYEIEFSE